jgi:hypothetical protein
MRCRRGRASDRVTGYRRRDLLERHTWRTGLSSAPEVAEAAALRGDDQ